MRISDWSSDVCSSDLTVTSVMCLILLGMAPRGATSAELLGAIGAVTDWARSRGIRLSSELESGDDPALSATVETLVESGLLTRYEAGREIVYSIDPATTQMPSYYHHIILQKRGG